MNTGAPPALGSVEAGDLSTFLSVYVDVFCRKVGFFLTCAPSNEFSELHKGEARLHILPNAARPDPALRHRQRANLSWGDPRCPPAPLCGGNDRFSRVLVTSLLSAPAWAPLCFSNLLFYFFARGTMKTRLEVPVFGNVASLGFSQPFWGKASGYCVF